MSVWELYTQLFVRNWRCGRFAQSLSQGCSEKIRKKDVGMTTGRWSSWSIQILQFLMLWWHAMKAGSTAMTQRARDRICSGSMLALPDPRRPDRTNPPTNFWWSFFWQHWHDLHALGSHWTDSQQGILCWGFKGVQEEIPTEKASTLQIGQWHFHQDNAPVHNSILVTDYLTKMGIKTLPHPPYSPDLAPCDFWLFPKLLLWDNWGDERGCDEGHWHAHTRRLSWDLSEVVEMVQQVHCSQRRLLWRGVEFHVCTIKRSAHMKKVWKLI